MTEPLALHGEGPCWLERSGEVAWVDMLAGRVLATSLASGETRAIGIPSRVAAIVRPRTAGGLVVATETGVVLLDGHDQPSPLCEIISEPGMRLNDGGCDPQGRFWCGSMAYDEHHEAGSLYRVEPDGHVDTVVTGVTISNGIGWSPDGATGGLSGRRRFADVGAGEIVPDGLAVDAEGGVWVALWNGGVVQHYAPGGALDAVVSLPCSRVTACAFGGADLGELIITTSRLDLPAGAEPAAGALFRCVPGVRGQAVLAFAG